MALSADSLMPLVVGDGAIGAAEDAVVYKGSLVSLSDTSGDIGYGHALVAGEVFVGHALIAVDNTDGSDGDLDIPVRAGRYRLKVSISAIAVTNVGDTVYASDDGTLTLTAGSNTTVGIVTRWISSGVCEVEFRPFP